jgi:pimeloyl-ACP methyl ester carboxylesterase
VEDQIQQQENHEEDDRQNQLQPPAIFARHSLLDFLELMNHLDIKDATMVGHSTGGGEVVRYIARHRGGGEYQTAFAVSIRLIATISASRAVQSVRPECVVRCA